MNQLVIESSRIFVSLESLADTLNGVVQVTERVYNAEPDLLTGTFAALQRALEHVPASHEETVRTKLSDVLG